VRQTRVGLTVADEPAPRSGENNLASDTFRSHPFSRGPKGVGKEGNTHFTGNPPYSIRRTQK
jgi:hypothetical protein